MPRSPASPPASDRLRGLLLCLALLSSIALGLGASLSPLLPGLLAWGVGLSLLPRLGRIQRLQTLIMLALGGLGMALGLSLGGDPAALVRALYANHGLIAMLGAVTFLRLVTSLRAERQALPRGRGALWRTLIGVHLFGAVINLSAMLIMGDRLARRGRITGLQARLLSRGFSLAAHWSPFFVAMGVALTQAQGAELHVLSLVGLPVAAVGLLIAGRDLERQPGIERLRGYPMNLAALAMPAGLAVCVILARQWWPGVAVVTLVAALSLLVTLGILFWRAPAEVAPRLARHVTQELPRMGGEVVLFLAAGVLSVGIGAAVTGFGLELHGLAFGAPLAAVLLAVMVALAVAGVHPLISIATVSGLLGPGVADPNLLGICFLMTWALGVAASPLSGMHMALQGRYGVPAHRFVAWNGRYVLWMLAVDSTALFLYDALWGR